MFLHFLHDFLVVFALAILIFIVIILTLARSNNFVCIFLYLQRASLVGVFWFLLYYFFLVLSFFCSFPFSIVPFFAVPVSFFFLVLLFVSSQSSTF